MRKVSRARQAGFRFAGAVPLALLLAAGSAPTASAQTVEEQLRQMRQEIAQLRDELSRVKALLPTAPEPGSDALVPAVEIPLLRAQVDEHARTKVESNSRFPVRIFGTVASNTYVNTGEPNWLDLGNVVLPKPAGLPAGSFNSSVRQTRFGLIVDGPDVGPMKSSGLMALDFFGGSPNFQVGQVHPLPRMVYAYMRMETDRTAIQVGQDQVMLAPRNPTSLTGLAFPILFRAGNLYLRAPQIRAERVVARGGLGELRAVGGIVAPVAGDFSTATYQFVPPNLAGERSRKPAVQSRVAWRAVPAGPHDEPSWEVAASGHYARERYLAGLLPSWAAAVDFDATVGRVGVAGEFFAGRNIDAFGASIAQIAKSRGGFLEARLSATRRWDFNGGYGMDRLYDRGRFPGALVENNSVFANTIYQLTPELGVSFEYRRLVTVPAAGSRRRNHHYDFTAAYSF